jgi:hypothetical protein
VAGSLAAGAKEEKTTMGQPSNAFYEDGAFNAEKAKQAYFDLMKRFGYPIQDVLLTEAFWVCDFVQRDFAKLGMGGIFWSNIKGVYGTSGAAAYQGDFKDKPFGYLGHEIYLLPGQMLPEHRHIGGPEGFGPKMESWHVRYGQVEFFGQHTSGGEEKPLETMAEGSLPWRSDESWFKCTHVTSRTAKSGDLYALADPESWHFMRAGPDGAIVSEYATYHNHVEFSKPGMEFDNSKANA